MGQHWKGELYDLQADRQEWVNRYDDRECAEIQAKLQEDMRAHLESIDGEARFNF